MAENYDVGERFWRTILWFICQPLPPQLQKKQPQSLNAAIKSLSKRVSMYCNVQVSEEGCGWHFWETQTTRGSATNYYQLYINRVMALDVHYIPSHKGRRKVEPRADIRGRGGLLTTQLKDLLALLWSKELPFLPPFSIGNDYAYTCYSAGSSPSANACWCKSYAIKFRSGTTEQWCFASSPNRPDCVQYPPL